MTLNSEAPLATADGELKKRHRSMWASGDYPALAEDIIPKLGEVIVEATDVRRGDQVLDIAAGAGNAALPAALRGAQVIASDLTPELFDRGRVRAAELGAAVQWEGADAEALPYDDASFDVVFSCVGIMFAPHHQIAADEMVRVCRPGGRIGVLSWTPEGFIGQMFAAMKPFAPAPPPGATPPPRWGDEEHVRGLLGDRVQNLAATRGSVLVERFSTGRDFVDYFKTFYGPTIAIYRGLVDTERAAELDATLISLAEQFTIADTPGAMAWEYLVVTADRA